jgi:hypothetical protein
MRIGLVASETSHATRTTREARPVTRRALRFLPVLELKIVSVIHRVCRIGPVGGMGKRLMAFEAGDSAGPACVEFGVARHTFIEFILHLLQDLPVKCRGGCIVPTLFMHLKLSRHGSREILLEIAAGTQKRDTQENGNAGYDGEESNFSHGLSSLVAVTAESNSTQTVRACIRVGMAGVTHSTGVTVPIPFLTRHKASRVRPRIGSLNPVRIHVARDAGRVGTLRIMAGGTTFDVASCERSV